MPPSPLIALVNGRVLGDHGPREGLAVLVRGKRIVAIVAHDDARVADAHKHDLRGHLLLPGFIDVQVNGGGGLLFNDAPTVETLRGIAEAHRKYGTTGMLPTLITDTAEKMRAALQAVDGAIEQHIPGILGIHVEGPFLANARKGIHNADLFRLPDDDDVEALIASHKGPVMLTLAPDQVPLPVIARLAGAGPVLDAAEQIRRLIDEVQGFCAHGRCGWSWKSNDIRVGRKWPSKSAQCHPNQPVASRCMPTTCGSYS